MEKGSHGEPVFSLVCCCFVGECLCVCVGRGGERMCMCVCDVVGFFVVVGWVGFLGVLLLLLCVCVFFLCVFLVCVCVFIFFKDVHRTIL